MLFSIIERPNNYAFRDILPPSTVPEKRFKLQNFPTVYVYSLLLGSMPAFFLGGGKFPGGGIFHSDDFTRG